MAPMHRLWNWIIAHLMGPEWVDPGEWAATPAGITRQQHLNYYCEALELEPVTASNKSHRATDGRGSKGIQF